MGTTVAVLVLVLVVGGGVWWWLGRDRGPEPSGDPPAVVQPAPDPDAPATSTMDLPELEASDEFVRRTVAGLSAHPQLARWLATDDLVHRFVRVVVDLAGNSNPSANVEFLIPEQEFQARQESGRLVIAPETHRRFDLLAATFASLDTQGTVRLYRDLRPLIEEAYEELGIPDHTFDDLLEMALQNLIRARVPDGPVEIVDAEGIYVFRDLELEARRGAEKALIRFGPANARRVQEKAAELARALEQTPG